MRRSATNGFIDQLTPIVGTKFDTIYFGEDADPIQNYLPVGIEYSNPHKRVNIGFSLFQSLKFRFSIENSSSNLLLARACIGSVRENYKRRTDNSKRILQPEGSFQAIDVEWARDHENRLQVYIIFKRR